MLQFFQAGIAGFGRMIGRTMARWRPVPGLVAVGGAEAAAKAFILGTVPSIDGDEADDCAAFYANHPRSDFARSIDRLAGKLFDGYQAPDGGRVVMLAALGPREGTTSLALCLAAAIAVQGGEILLIDADPARRGLSKRLALDTSVGLSDVIAGTCSANKAIVREGDVAVLPFGRAALDAGRMAQALADALPSFLAEARTRFDLILVDTSAFDTGTEAALLAAHADAVALVTCWDNLLRDDFIAIVDTMADRPNFAGLILNRAKRRAGDALALAG